MGENFCELVKNMIFTEKTRRLLACAAPKDATPLNLQKKLLRIATNPRNSRKFSHTKVSRYTTFMGHSRVLHLSGVRFTQITTVDITTVSRKSGLPINSQIIC